MTSSSCHYFYTNVEGVSIPRSKLRYGGYIWAVTVSKRKLTIEHKKMIVETEKLVETREITLHANSHGEKYLTTIRHLENSINPHPRNDWSLHMQHALGGILSKECEEFIDKVVCSWFEEKYESRWVAKRRLSLMFPVFRGNDPEITQTNSRLVTALAGLEAVTSGAMSQNLRRSSNWADFVARTLKQKDDVYKAAHILKSKPQLLEFATLSTGASFTDLYEYQAESIETFNNAFTTYERDCLRFMLANLPAKDRLFATHTLLSIASDRSKKTFITYSGLQFIEVSYAYMNSFDRGLKKLLSTAFLSELTRAASEERHPQSPLDFHSVFGHWFAGSVLEPSLESSISVNEWGQRFTELFGVSYTGDDLEFLTSENGMTVCNYLAYSLATNNKDLFSSLAALVDELPESRSSKTSTIGYNDTSGEFQRLSGIIFSLDDVASIVEQGREIIDEALSNQGREITPANRSAYLSFNLHQRNSVTVWHYFDLGVTNPMRIDLLERSGVTDPEEIKTYASLPDDMFEEFLQLHSGAMLNKKSANKWNNLEHYLIHI